MAYPSDPTELRGGATEAPSLVFAGFADYITPHGPYQIAMYSYSDGTVRVAVPHMLESPPMRNKAEIDSWVAQHINFKLEMRR